MIFLLRRQSRMSEWNFAEFGNTRTDTDKRFDRRQIFDSIRTSRGHDAHYAALQLSFSWRIRWLEISADFTRCVDHFRGNREWVVPEISLENVFCRSSCVCFGVSRAHVAAFPCWSVACWRGQKDKAPEPNKKPNLSLRCSVARFGSGP